jgi:hypothetical protein
MVTIPFSKTFVSEEERRVVAKGVDRLIFATELKRFGKLILIQEREFREDAINAANEDFTTLRKPKPSMVIGKEREISPVTGRGSRASSCWRLVGKPLWIS